MTGRLVIAATPIGDVRDASPRLREAIESADLIAAEDTRRLRRLAANLGVVVSAPVLAYHDAVERERLPRLIDRLRAGGVVLLVTDAGMPSISDPGYRAVDAAVSEGIEVTVIPGPSAVTAALAVSGLAVDRFCFEGFLPRKPGERAARLSELAAERRTLVLFEAPHRLHATLISLAEAFGADRRAAVCRELTKTYEEVVRARLGELVVWAEGEVRGEITLVIEGSAGVARSIGADELASLVTAAEAAGLTRKEAIADVAATSGVPKRVVFDAVVAAKQPPAARP